MTQPRFSFVATSRNDDHGGDVLRRTQSFIDRLAVQCERHQVAAELILVEWNPPQSRAPLAEVLGWPAGSEWFSARVVTVPRHVHLSHRHGSRLALFQMIGKNIGIRRAAGEQIIATNIDIIFSDELFEWLARGEFRDGVLYRSDRWDIPNEIQLEPDLDVLLQRARNESIRRNRKEGTYIRRDGTFINATPDRFDDVFYNAMTAEFANIRAALTDDSPLVREELLNRIDELLSNELPRRRRNFYIPLLHTNGCGDFTMLSRKDWFRLRGYPEWHIFSWTIDSVLLLQAHYNGMEIEELDQRRVHYHIEHDYGSGWTPEGAGSLWARMDERRIPYMSYGQYTDLAYELQDNLKRNVFTIYNGPDWGLVGRDIHTLVVAKNGNPARLPSTINAGNLVEDAFAELQQVNLGNADDEVFRAFGRAQLAFHPHESGLDVGVESSPERWSYAVEVDLSGTSGDRWLNLSVTVETGSVGIGILNAEGSDFIEEKIFVSHESTQEVGFFLNETVAVSKLVFRNTTEGDRPARFTIRRLQMLADLDAYEEFPLVGARPIAPADPALDAGEPQPWDGLAAMHAGSPGAILRVLASPEGQPDNGAADHQLLVVTPAEHGAWGGLLALPDETLSGVLSLDLHVIDGMAGIGIRSRTTDQIVVEHQAAAGTPLTRLELDLAAAEMADALIIRNLSGSGPAKVLIHRLDYTARAASASG